MLKTSLTAEQSAKLIELGVSPERASMRESSVAYGNGARGIMKVPETPIFTLTDILDILPRSVMCEDLEIGFCGEDWCAAYDEIMVSIAPELIDALYSLLVRVIDHKHVKLG